MRRNKNVGRTKRTVSLKTQWRRISRKKAIINSIKFETRKIKIEKGSSDLETRKSTVRGKSSYRGVRRQKLGCHIYKIEWLVPIQVRILSVSSVRYRIQTCLTRKGFIVSHQWKVQNRICFCPSYS